MAPPPDHPPPPPPCITKPYSATLTSLGTPLSLPSHSGFRSREVDFRRREDHVGGFFFSRKTWLPLFQASVSPISLGLPPRVSVSLSRE
ncbi:hypothetical protein IE53DRAFT_52597 [Violaceomyces palustris]|uniref:Uncharacterized protein n=1 Tax=Violaceomyces palustris TaxID=1673888 RepID=A0ACD0NZX0_9BASI|nr:hypothetical protein IE53DRAFT_52597 [Violaceomyces palustris]